MTRLGNMREDPEYGFVIAAAAPCRDAAAHERLRRAAAAPLDWTQVFDAAQQWRVASLVALNLFAAGVEVPAAIRALFEEVLLHRTTIGLAALGQARDVQRRLAAAGIDALVYKGPALAIAAQGHLGARAMADLDVLVRRADLAAARDALAAAGYALDVHAHRLFAALPLAAREDHFYPANTNDFPVELHVSVVPWPLAVRFDTDACLARAVVVRGGETGVRTFDAEDHLLVVAAHATSHWWLDPRHVADLAGLLGAGIRWDVVRARARAARVERMLATGLVLAHDTLALPLPGEILDWARRDPEAGALAALARARWRSPADAGGLKTRWRNAYRASRYRERLGDKARYVVREQVISLLEKVPWERWRPPPRHLSSPSPRR